MAEVKLSAEARMERGKGAARRARRSGFVPAVLYGKDWGSTALQVPAKEIEVLLQHGRTRLVALRLDGATDEPEKERTAIIKDVQLHPSRGEVVHVDFQAVSMDQEVATTVPVRLSGEEGRPNDGGIVSQAVREIDVACRANRIPEYIDVNVSELEAGENLTVADLQPSEEIRLLASPDEVVVSVLEKSRAADLPEEGETDEAEPEAAETDEGAQEKTSDES